MDNIIDEYIYELTRAVGDGYSAIIDGVGDYNQPGTALFGVSQLSDLANKNIPYFGAVRMVDPTDSTYAATKAFRIEIPDIAKPEILINSASVAYDGQILNIKEQYLSYARDFADIYPADYIYGVVAGFPIAEAEKASSMNTVLVLADTPQYSHTLPVDNIIVATNLGFPLLAYIGNEMVTFVGTTTIVMAIDGVDTDVVVLQIDSSTPGLLTEKRKGTQVLFIYDPKPKLICGLPVAPEHQSGKNPNDFCYYPPLPKDWLPIAKMLVNVKDPNVVDDIPKIINMVIKTNCDVATTGSDGEFVFSSYANGIITTSNSIGFIDGIEVQNNDRILVKHLDGVDAPYNGIYKYVSASGCVIRATDADASVDFPPGFIANIIDGNQNGNKSFIFGSDDSTFTLDTSDVVFNLYSISMLSDPEYAIIDTVVDYPYGTSTSPIFTDDESITLSAAADAAAMSLLDLKQRMYLNDFIRAMQLYTNAVKESSTVTFAEFWAKRPFKATTYFTKGIAFDNIERFEFPDNFIKAYYDFTKEDLRHTFAIFRGDLYQSESYNTNDALQKPTNISINSYLSRSTYSLLQRGTYVYGITAVNDSFQETSALYIQTANETNSEYINEIKSSDATPDGIVYYHIYRRKNLVGEQVEYRLTSDEEIKTLVTTDSPQFAYEVTDMDAVTNSITITDVTLSDGDVITFSAGSGGLLPGGITATTLYTVDNYSNGNFTLLDDTTPVNITSSFVSPCYVNVDTNYSILNSTDRYVFKFKSDSLVNTLFGGIGIKLRLDTGVVYNATSKINVALYSDADDVNAIAIGASIYFGDIISSSNYSEYIVKFDNIELTANTVYWVGLTLDELPIDIDSNSIDLYINRFALGNTNSEFGHVAAGSYSQDDLLETYYNIYSFIDDGQTSSVTTSKRGIKLTNAIALIPRNLRVYIPDIDIASIDEDSESTNTRNEVVVTVVAKNGEHGIPKTFAITVPKDTTRNTQFVIGNADDVFDRVVDVQVQPGSINNLRISQGRINWSIYDLITVESVV